MPLNQKPELSQSILETLPNPVLVKDSDLRYVWVNSAFESLFGVSRDDLIGQLDTDVFKERQAAQCNGGDIRVLETDAIDESYETVFSPDGTPVETITRKSRLSLSDGSHYLVGVLHDVTVVTRANEKLVANEKILRHQSVQLRSLANTDPLTACLNRRALFEKTVQSLDGSPSNYSLLALDLDYFKNINDEYGHNAGDAALVHFASLVRKAIREEDVFARHGGEEFVVIVPKLEFQAAIQIAERICELVAATPVIHDSEYIPMTVSIGVGICHSGESAEFQEVMKQADEALYQAKNGGRNQVVSPDFLHSKVA